MGFFVFAVCEQRERIKFEINTHNIVVYRCRRRLSVLQSVCFTSIILIINNETIHTLFNFQMIYIPLIKLKNEEEEEVTKAQKQQQQ